MCLAQGCIFAGIGCRDDEHCAQGDRCNVELERCEAGEQPCVPDAFEPNEEEEEAEPIEGPAVRASLCPSDVDWFSFQAGDEDEIDAVFTFNTDAANLDVVLRLGGRDLVRASPTEGGALLQHTARGPGLYTLRVSANDPEARLSYSLTLTITSPMMCVDTELFRDDDQDGFGNDGDSILACVEVDEVRPGFAREAGDCGPGDPLRYPGAEGICGDRVDDDCVGGDEACPETSDAPPVIPDWDCSGDAPSSVYASARFADGQGYFRDGGCFFFFEGLPGEFYVKRNLVRANDDPGCTGFSGCTCPSLNGWPAYDRRMYAFTLQGSIDDCPDIWLRDHAQIDAELMVSNACRKYLLQLHDTVPREVGFVTGNIENLEQRLRLYSSVEVACVEDRPHRNLPYQSLLQAEIVLNPNFQAQ